MRIKVVHTYFTALKEAGCTNEDVLRTAAHNWGRDEGYTLNLGDLNEAELALVEKKLTDDGQASSVRKLQQFKKVRANPTGATVSRLEALEIAFKEWMYSTPNKWLFKRELDGNLVPYYVESLHYEEANKRNERPASVTIRLRASLRGREENESLVFDHASLKGKMTVEQLMNKRGYFRETPDLVEQYQVELARLKEIREQVGEQFHATGLALVMVAHRHYAHEEITEMVRDGAPANVVMDDPWDENNEGDAKPVYAAVQRSASYSAWTEYGIQKKNGTIGGSKVKKAELDLGDDEMTVECPAHPYVKVYDLGKHRFAKIHVNNLVAKTYEKDLMAKLVLPEENKDLITILIDSSNDLLEDIVKGKTGGTIVLSTGEPGTGKTLTAQVFAEEMQRPLYTVQCSQLGTDPVALEQNLDTVLARAIRWKAILLLDEADVYVHERGNDIDQNAIVGVFLRVLENFRGVLFMTSNRDVIVDDAIASRATAHLRYYIPDTEASLDEVWHVLTRQYEIPLHPKLAKELAEDFPPGSISPRNIKNILKLARTQHLKRGLPIDRHLFRRVSKFVGLAHPEKLPEATLSIRQK